MAKKERAPKKEKPTKREKEILRKSAAERRENRKSNGFNALITVIVVLLLIGVSTVVGLVVKNDGSVDASDAQTSEQNRDRDWVITLLQSYDGTVSYLTQAGYTAGGDFEANYDAAKAETSNGLVGTIKMTDASGYFEIYYFAETPAAAASKNAQAHYNQSVANRVTADGNLLGRVHGSICFLGKGDTFENLFLKYYKINGEG